jgi:hypothetical protein
MNQQVFNDLASVSIFHFCDVLYKDKAIQAAKRLVKLGMIESLDDAENAYSQYEKMVVDYVQERIPELKRTYDYYGAVCLSDHQGWNAPKQAPFAGDSQARIMWFDDFSALKEYTGDQMKTPCT